MDNYQDKIESLLSTHVMFNTLSNEDRIVLKKLFEVKTYEPSNIVAEQLTPIEGMYYLCEGKVRIKETIEGRRQRIGDYDEEGGAFGELSLLQESVWEYQLETLESKVVFLFLPSIKVRNLLKKNSDMEKIFKKYIGKILFSQRLRSMLGSSKYTTNEFNEILNNFGIKKITKDKPLFNQNDSDPRLYLIETGTVDLIKEFEKETITLDRCVQGEIIGEWAAIDPTAKGCHPYSAVAVTNITVLVIYAPEVQKILSINPTLHNRFIERINSLKNIVKTELDSLKRTVARDLRLELSEGITEDEFRILEKDKKEIEKIPVVRQNDESECGAACLTMITKYYGKNLNLGQIKELTNLSNANASPINIITGAENLGYQAKAHALKYKNLREIKLPGIIGWEGSHYAVLYKFGGNKVHIVDPEVGQKTINRDDFIKGWTEAEIPGLKIHEEQGLFIALNPTAKFTNFQTPKKPITNFINYLLPFKAFFFEAMIAAMIINLLGIASPLFVQTIVDNVVVHKDYSLLNIMLGGMVLVSVLTTLTRVVQTLLLSHTIARVDMLMMSEFYRHVLSLPISFFLTRNKGEILARFGENQKIRSLITGSTLTIILNTLMLIVYFLMMFGYSWKLTLIVIAFIPGYILLILYYTPKIKEISQKIFLTNSQSQSYLIESLNGIETIKATANEYMARARWENTFVENVNNSFQQSKLSLMSNSLHGLLTLGTNVVILWVGAKQVMSGTMSIGELMGFNMFVGLVMSPIQQMIQLWNQMQEIRISIERVSDVLNVKPEQEPFSSPDRMPAVLSDCKGKIEFVKVNFSYMTGGKENLVMKDFDLIIEQGQRVAFVGASGCGKSTCAKMILGFNVAKSGECKIDGKNIIHLDLKSLRKNIGIVLQDSFLISGTVAENIALGDPEPDLQAVKRAARLAGVDGEILRWPLGYQTPIGEKGMGISGGQRQRVCIARALYWDPKILIFDEATSSLDNESEKLIQSNMKEILKNRTSITIAHRLSTIIDSDMICFIHEGKVVEKGTHKDLIDTNYLKKNGYTGKYYMLAEKQFNLKPLNLNE
ncbi:MAG: peptidase domain-containing ABC transporter, partial [Desulfobacterales bacterium]|nr:peptidase domain-containing ABC transporter [Desulfobacterales bacterium]